MSEHKLYLDQKGNLRQRRKRRNATSSPQTDLLVTPPDEARRRLRELIDFINTPTETTDHGQTT